MAPGVDMATVANFVGALFGTFLTSEMLYKWSHHTEVWLAVFIVFYAYLSLLITISEYLQAEADTPHKDGVASEASASAPRAAFLQFLDMLIVLTLLRLLGEEVMYGIAVTHMTWLDYLVVIECLVFTVFVLLYLFVKLATFRV